jgi:hypothetical protein
MMNQSDHTADSPTTGLDLYTGSAFTHQMRESAKIFRSDSGIADIAHRDGLATRAGWY